MKLNLSAVPSEWDKVNSCDQTFSTEQANAIVNATNASKFLLYKTGSLGSGIYVANGTICVAEACKDRSGNFVYKRCTFRICMAISPSGNCGFATPVIISATQIGSCSTGCDPC